MEAIVVQALRDYNRYSADAAMHKAWLQYFKDDDRQKQLDLLSTKIAIIDGWLKILRPNERFVVREHIINDNNWEHVVGLFKKEWGKEDLARSERTLKRYQAAALKKIVQFANRFHDQILSTFASEESATDNADKGEC